MSVDLHLHTHYSDGNWSPSELVENAIASRLKCIAVTDHDTCAGLQEARQTAGTRLEIINGIEINTVLDGQDVHILGYFIDPEASDLKAVMELQQGYRHQLVDHTIAVLASEGTTITKADVARLAGKGSIGRPHLSQAIVAAGAAADVTEAFSKYMHRGSPHYLPRRAVRPDQAIAAIRAAGGLASLAHPGKDKNLPDLVRTLKDMGLSALEAFHRSHGLPDIKRLMKLARDNKLLISGGSDCHGPSKNFPPSLGSVSVPLDVVQNLRAACQSAR